MNIILTVKEKKILEALAEGNDYKQIAPILQLKPNTIRSHIEVMRKKLSARNTAHAVSKGYKLGLLKISKGEEINATLE